MKKGYVTAPMNGAKDENEIRELADILISEVSTYYPTPEHISVKVVLDSALKVVQRMLLVTPERNLLMHIRMYRGLLDKIMYNKDRRDAVPPFLSE